jgi:hypothetical protein
MKDAIDFFGLSISDDLRTNIANYNLQFNSSWAMVSINKDIVIDFVKNIGGKSDFDIAVFLAYCGLRSILGNKTYTKTNNEHLMARMAGYNTYDDYKKSGARIDYFETNFSTVQKIRYQLTQKIIEKELMLKWGLKYYSSNSRGFYFGFNIEFRDLVRGVELSKKTIKVKQLKKTNAEIIRDVKSKL